LLFTVSSVEFADVLPVYEYLSIVVRIVHCEGSGRFQFRQGSAVEDASEALVVFFHGADVFILLCCGQVLEQWCHFCESESRDADRFDQCRYFRLFLTIHVFRHGFSQRPILRSCLTGFTDRRIIIVRRHVGCKAGRVGACPVSPVRTSMCHIQAE